MPATTTRELVADDPEIIETEREEPKGRGYPATALTLNPEGGFAIGVDVSPIGIDVALVNLAGDIIGQQGREIVDRRAAFDVAFGQRLVAVSRHRSGGDARRVVVLLRDRAAVDAGAAGVVVLGEEQPGDAVRGQRDGRNGAADLDEHAAQLEDREFLIDAMNVARYFAPQEVRPWIHPSA